MTFLYLRGTAEAALYISDRSKTAGRKTKKKMEHERDVVVFCGKLAPTHPSVVLEQFLTYSISPFITRYEEVRLVWHYPQKLASLIPSVVGLN